MNCDKSTQLKAVEGSVINLLRINLWTFFHSSLPQDRQRRDGAIQLKTRLEIQEGQLPG